MLRILTNLRLIPSTSSVYKTFLSTASTTEDVLQETPQASQVEQQQEKDVDKKDKEFLRKEYSMESFQTMKLDQYPYYVEREWWKRGKRMTFWATWRQLRDVKRRETIQELGADRMRLKALKENTILPQAIRDEAAEKLFTMPLYSHPRLVLNMCMFTGRQRGKIKPYRVNRHIFRKLADHSQLSGVQRAMW